MARQLLGRGIRRWVALVALTGTSGLLVSCASGDDSTTIDEPPVAGGKAGAAGKGGAGGSAGGGKGGAAGSSSGASGTGGSAGSGGSGGSGGQSGKSGASGQAGSAGNAGDAGAAGDAGQGGAAGDAGNAGSAGDGGANCNQVEICNGIDDDCDGQKDEDVGGTNEPCTVPNKQGECAFGTTQCLKGKLECAQNVGASVEICDGKDNNCDGQIDNAPTDVGGSCFTDQKGLCAQGTLKCVDGAVKCVSNFQPTDETCNGFDDNCDGNVDEGFPGAGQPCTIEGKFGPCAQGQTTCQNSGNQCAPVNNPSTEVCDGVDNDCDGQIDEKDDTEGQPCDVPDGKGECAKGTTLCVDKAAVCNPLQQPGAETCDGKDNDCDGQIDNIAATKLKTECTKVFPSGKNVQDWACVTGECVISTCTGTFDDCNASPSDGCEINTDTDVGSCGGCGNPCPSINGTPTCISGACGIVCSGSFDNCDGQVGNGCEQPLNSDPKNCGACNKKCSDAGGVGFCNGGTCKTECDAGKADCNGSNGDGCEVDTTSDAANCGGCNKPCSGVNAQPFCEGGVCKPKCKPGFADCDGDPGTGCEVKLSTDKENCGACGNACDSTNGNATCSSGKCGLSCFSGFEDCDLDPGNGCETKTDNSITNCGGCGVQCNAANGTAKCTLGVCGITCNPGFKNCNSDADDGCEINSNADPNNCGGCGQFFKCNLPNAQPTCDAGICKIASCNQGFADCNNNPGDGCETNTTIDNNNCGVCNKKCSASGGSSTCQNGVCSAIQCAAGLADCDGDGATCETNLNSSNTNCGVCGNFCAPINATSNSCILAKCVPLCQGGFEDCDKIGTNGCEANLNTDTNNCGGCGVKCVPTNADGATCSNAGGAAKCVFQCKPGFADCDSNPANGCETNLNSDLANCGQCGKGCSIANGAGTCSAGKCQVLGCSPPYDNCNGDPSDGCETNTTVSAQNCGGCGKACSTNHSSPVCESAQCKTGTCSGAFKDCNNNPNDGCETDTGNDINNCNGCGIGCPVTANALSMKCESSTCEVASCASGYDDVDKQGGNGCECKEDTASDSCGGATDLGVITLGQSKPFVFNLTGLNGADDTDWFKVTFPNSSSCNHSPTIELSVGSQPIRMRVYTSCNGSSGAGGITCGANEPANSGAGDLLRWDFNINKSCGDNNGTTSWADPFPGSGSFVQEPTTLFIQVFRTGAVGGSCLPYTITVSNTLN